MAGCVTSFSLVRRLRAGRTLSGDGIVGRSESPFAMFLGYRGLQPPCNAPSAPAEAIAPTVHRAATCVGEAAAVRRFRMEILAWSIVGLVVAATVVTAQLISQ